MILEFKTNKLKRQCEDPCLAQKEYGTSIGFRLTQRIGELLAAKNLFDIKTIPSARLHRLEGNRNDQYAVDLVHPFRLVIRPLITNKNSINKLELITVVRIEEVEDYHGKQKRR